MHATFLVCLLLAVTCRSLANGAETTPNPRQGADLLKTDLLAVFAHPDDETGMAAALAHYALGEDKTVAVIYATRGEGGGNMVGTHWGPSLGILREAELRDCLALLGIRQCHFLDQLDWAYTESLAATLRKWGHEESLRRLVRLVRALRPEVIVTMSPAPNPGQHGHHQAAGVLAIEAFDAAADPSHFPEQITKEGLTAWQPRKLYISGGRAEDAATIVVTNTLPLGKTPAELAGAALANHRSQGFGSFAGSSWLARPQRFTLVKSVVAPARAETNLFQGLPVADRSPRRVALGTETPTSGEIQLRFIPRPAVANYQRWLKEQHIEHIGSQFLADVPVVSGQPNTVQLELRNSSDAPWRGLVRLESPAGWSWEKPVIDAAVEPRATRVVQARLIPPANNAPDANITATLTHADQVFRATARAHPVPRMTAARVKSAPALDGSDRGWERIASQEITPAQRVQGNVRDAADSSATFRLAHDGRRLFLDLQVRDDVVVRNIAPNDIRGHWRTDSIELCLDPAAGAEDTMGCFKLGVFPFDTTGVVRAARDADANQGPIEETAPGTRVLSRRTADGYRIQVAVPFAELGLKAKKGSTLGFNIILYDGDKQDAALGENINKSRLAWAPRPGVNGRPEDWGRVVLE
jgi:LmbE family N-acetylglucosaminyl deacetylase